jgi:hypothetical protein
MPPGTPACPAYVVTLSAAAPASVSGLIVKGIVPLIPPALTTLSARMPGSADNTSNADAEVPLITLTPSTTMPVPLAVTVVAPGMKFVPVSVAVTVCPCVPEFGLTAFKVGIVEPA